MTEAGAVGGERERVGGEAGVDLRHARENALRQKFPGVVDDQEPAVAGEAQTVKLGCGYGVAPQGFHGVDEKSGDAGHGGREGGRKS